MAFYITLETVYDYILFILSILLPLVVLFLERKNTSTALAWMAVMIFFPELGFFLYLMLSQNIARRKIFKYTEEEAHLYNRYLMIQRKAISDGAFNFHEPLASKYVDHIIFHNQLSESFYTQNNQVEIFTDGHDKFKQLFKDIKEAKHHIHILYYIIQNDDLGNQLLELLTQKAKSGVEVRLLMDHMGSRRISNRKIKHLRAAGLEVATFFPSKLKFFNLRANYRNHRKIVVIDGLIGYIGGFNVGDEYLGKSKRFGYWRDTHLKIIGDAVVSLQIRFFLDWRLASRKMLQMTSDYIKESPDDNLYEDPTPDHLTNPNAINPNGSGMQIVSCGPDSVHEQIKQGFIKLINSAKEYIYIQTPYFIPDESITEALKIAASSGIEIKIMIPNKPDHIFVLPANLSYIYDLLPFGIKAYMYENGFLHSKYIVVDGKLSSVGTCNFDNRSFRLNFEVNAFIYDPKVSKELANIFNEDLSLSKEVTTEIFQNRSLYMRFRDRISRLFSPIL